VVAKASAKREKTQKDGHLPVSMSAHKQHKQKQEDADAADGLCFIAAQVFCILMMCLAGMLFGGIIGEMQARVPLWLARFML
jgi:hypothetical protein